MTAERRPLSSPCVRLCTLDPATDRCVGCGRSLTEITRWSALSESERQAIMAELPGRLARR